MKNGRGNSCTAVAKRETAAVTADVALANRMRQLQMQKGGFYHDGRFANLRGVLDHYDQHFHLWLNETEKMIQRSTFYLSDLFPPTPLPRRTLVLSLAPCWHCLAAMAR